MSRFDARFPIENRRETGVDASDEIAGGRDEYESIRRDVAYRSLRRRRDENDDAEKSFDNTRRYGGVDKDDGETIVERRLIFWGGGVVHRVAGKRLRVSLRFLCVFVPRLALILGGVAFDVPSPGAKFIH